MKKMRQKPLSSSAVGARGTNAPSSRAVSAVSFFKVVLYVESIHLESDLDEYKNKSTWARCYNCLVRGTEHGMCDKCGSGTQLQ